MRFWGSAILYVNGMGEAPQRVAVVFNPASSGFSAKGGAAERRRAIQAALAARGARTLWYETSTENNGRVSAQRAVGQGIDVLLVAGGDGTVMACAKALAGTGIPLAIIPSGTGNIVAASLRVPGSVAAAVEIALHGDRRWIDVGVSGPDHMFFASSIGFGAAVMRDATPALKARTGMLAYLLTAARHLRDCSGTVRLRLDDEPLIAHKSDGVLVGNFGQLMSRPRLPRTSLDDGLLEVGVLRIRPFLDWLRRDLPAFRPSRPPPLDWYQARRVTVDCSRAQAIERDGDWVGSSPHLEARVLPRSVVVCVPRSVEALPLMRPLWRWVARDAGRLLVRRSS